LSNKPSPTSRERDYRSRKFGLTVYSVVLLPALLFFGYLQSEHFVAVFPMVLGLYFAGNVVQKRYENYSEYDPYDVRSRYSRRDVTRYEDDNNDVI
jgi:hypothetical protein